MQGATTGHKWDKRLFVLKQKKPPRQRHADSCGFSGYDGHAGNNVQHLIGNASRHSRNAPLRAGSIIRYVT
jgi:hypothetical protein